MTSEINQPLLGKMEDEVEEHYNIRSIYNDHSFCCLHLSYFPVAKMWICGDWICSLTVPIIASIIFLITALVCLYDIYYYIDDILIKYLLIGIFSFICLCVMFSYFSMICIGPGYLPFNYDVYKKTWDELCWEEKCNNFASYYEQVEFARQSKRPPRCCFSMLARRFVLRADHFCDWTQTWIGLKNMRYFVLFTGYLTLYCLSWFGFHYWWVFSKPFTPFAWQRYISIAAGLIVVLFLSLACKFFLRSSSSLIHNVTALERLKGLNTSTYDKGCFNNCSEVCGKKKFVCLWFIPFFYFKPLSNGLYEIVENNSVVN